MSAPTAHVPPQNIEAEESVLGAMLVAEPTLTRVIDEVKLNAGDFYLEKHAAIFTAIHDLYAASKPVDELSVTEALAQHNRIEEAGGKHYVSELAAKVPAAGNAKHYAEIVQQNSLLRRLLGGAQNVIEAIHNRSLNGEAAELAQLLSASSHLGRRVELTAATEIRSERVQFLDGGRRFPRRGMVIVAGEKGLGKSTYTNAYLPSQITRGTLGGELGPADVVLATAEDDWPSVVKPRNMAHGTDLHGLHRLQVLDEAGQVTLTFPDDVQLLEAQLDTLEAAGRQVAALVIDPISAFLSDRTDSHNDASTRRALAPLAAMAERRDLVVIVVAHLNKDESKRLISRVQGSGAFVNAARSVLAFARHPDDPDGEQGCERVIVHTASNWGTYAPTQALKIEGCQVEVDDGSMTDIGHVVMGDEIDLGVEELQRGGAEESGSDTEEEIAAKLADGPRPSREIKSEIVGDLGCSRRTVERAARRMEERGELETESGGFPRTTTWRLSNDSAVATSAVSMHVATSQIGATKRNRPDSGDSSDSGDTPPARDATQAEEAEIERLASKLGAVA